jgi:cytochrome c-type biogenesis protein CcmH/NrfF
MGILMKLLWLAPLVGAVIGLGHVVRVIQRDTQLQKDYIALRDRQKEATQHTTT